MVSLLFGIALLFAVYAIAKRLYGRLPGLVAALLVPAGALLLVGLAALLAWPGPAGPDRRRLLR